MGVGYRRGVRAGWFWEALPVPASLSCCGTVCVSWVKLLRHSWLCAGGEFSSSFLWHHFCSLHQVGWAGCGNALSFLPQLGCVLCASCDASLKGWAVSGWEKGRISNTSPDLGALGCQSCLWNHSNNSESQTPSLQCFLRQLFLISN